MAGSGNVARRRLRAAPTIGSVATGGRILAPILPLVIVIYMFLLFPIETRPQVLGVNLPIYRFGIILFTPFMLARLTSVRTRFLFADWLMVLATAWTLISFCAIYGIGPGLIRASGVVIDFAGAYTLARLAIDSPTALRRFLILIAPGLFLAGFEMFIESVTDRLIVRPFFAKIFGAVAAYDAGEISGTVEYVQEQRLGLLRAYGPFSHPILGGAVLISMLPLWIKSGIRSWPLWAGIVASLMGLYSVSSAAFLGFAFGATLLAIDFGKKYVRTVNWPVVTILMTLVLLAVELVSGSGVTGVLARLTLDPQTAYYRILIWEFGSKSVMAHPWIGLGYFPFERPAWMSPSVDAHFLALALRNGLPVPTLFIAIIVLGMIGTGLRSGVVGGRDRDLLVGLNFSLAVLMLISMSVNYFGETNVWFMIIVGITATFSAGVRVDRRGMLTLAPPQQSPLPSPQPDPAPVRAG